jgi:ABC-type nitrate/sulfonate/bicarbonate transport system permease component
MATADLGHLRPLKPFRLRAGLGEASRWLVFAVLFLAGWELAARLYDQPYLLPAPSAVLREFADNRLLVWQYTTITFQEIALGFLYGSAVALAVAALFLWLPSWLEDLLYRLVVTINSTPFVALASLAVVWFGIGVRSKVIIAALYAFFAVMYHAHRAFLSVPRLREQLLDLYNASWAQRMLLLKVPSALPILFTSLKGGVMAAVNGAIVGELFGATEGLGFMILDARYVGNTVRVFLAAVTCTLIGWLLLALVSLAERVMLPWHAEVTGRPK